MQSPYLARILRCAFFSAALLISPAFAQDEPTAATPGARLPDDQPRGATATTVPDTSLSSSSTSNAPASAGQPSEAEMMKMMMELSKLNENHKLLGQLAGTWSFVTKLWMDPSKPPQESKGTGVRKAIMDGRFYIMDVSGRLAFPGPDGKMMDMDFKGMSLEAYDNAKQKFVSTWVDNMGTGIMMSEGTYDAASKTFTHTGEYLMAPGMKQKIRETVKIVDNDHHMMEWFEDRGGEQVKTMEIAYTRKK
jgi:hypothetical protein